MADGEDHVLLGDQVLDPEVLDLPDDLGAPRIAVRLLQPLQFLFDHLEHLALALQEHLVRFDLLDELQVLGLEFVAFQGREALQLHLEDGLRLPFAEVKFFDQRLSRLLRALGLPDGLDHRVQVCERFLQAFQDVRPLLRFGQLKLRAADDDVFAVVDEDLQERLQPQHPGPAVNEREQDDAEGRLHLRVLIELVQHHLVGRVAFELNDDAHPVTVRLIAQIGDALEAPVLDELGDRLDQVGLVDLVGELRDDDRLAVALELLRLDLGADPQAAAAGLIGVPDPVAPADDRARRKIRPLHMPRQPGRVEVGIVDERAGGAHDFSQVVRRDVRRHAHRDAA